MTDEKPLHIAIIGGGIAGITTALGLLSRNIRVTVYERGGSFREIGAGIGFTPNAERAMHLVDPRVHRAFKQVAVQNQTDWFMWVDGYGSQDEVPLIHKMYLGERGFEGCHRAQFLDELVKMIPSDTVHFHKNLESIVEREGDLGLLLRFHDGTTAEADAVIGCDGIRSRVRQIILGEDNPASIPGYSHKYAFRGLIPMEKAEKALSEEKRSTRHMYLGRNAHALTFPVAGGDLLNVVAFVTDPEDWQQEEKMTAAGTKAEAVEAFAKFNPTVRAIIDLLPENLEKWAVFDTYDHPPSTYAKGQTCIAGDAAHAAAPHHGAGAGFCIEDAAVLVALLALAQTEIEQGHDGPGREKLLRSCLEVYSEVRLERTQWLVQSSRFVGELYEGEKGDDAAMCRHEIDWRAHRIWDYDVEAMVEQSIRHWKERTCSVEGRAEF